MNFLVYSPFFLIFLAGLVLTQRPPQLPKGEKLTEQVLKSLSKDVRQHLCSSKLTCLIGAYNLTAIDDQSNIIRGIADISRLGDRMVAKQIGHRLYETYIQGLNYPESCQSFNCHLSDYELLEAHLSRKEMVRLFHPRVKRGLFGSRKRRYHNRRTYGLKIPSPSSIYRHPIRIPEDAKYREVCRRCEAKRSSCNLWGIGTWGVCQAAYFAAGWYGSIVCNVVTFPRSYDCFQHSWNNCFIKDCGAIDLPF